MDIQKNKKEERFEKKKYIYIKDTIIAIIIARLQNVIFFI